MVATRVCLWGTALSEELVTFLERFCPALDRGAEEVAVRWKTPFTRTTVHGGPREDMFSIEVREGTDGPGGINGLHTQDFGLVWADWDWRTTPNALTRALSHELFEWLVNPDGRWQAGALKVEVCDPVCQTPWVVNGGQGPVVLANFVYPSYFGLGSGGDKPPYDQVGVLNVPGHPQAGAYQTVNGVPVLGHPKRPDGIPGNKCLQCGADAGPYYCGGCGAT